MADDDIKPTDVDTRPMDRITMTPEGNYLITKPILPQLIYSKPIKETAFEHFKKAVSALPLEYRKIVFPVSSLPVGGDLTPSVDEGKRPANGLGTGEHSDLIPNSSVQPDTTPPAPDFE